MYSPAEEQGGVWGGLRGHIEGDVEAVCEGIVGKIGGDDVRGRSLR